MNVLAEFIDKFRLNFIEDKRYEFIFNGLKTTLIITAFAVLIGIVLGFIIAMIRSTHDRTGKMKILNAICKAVSYTHLIDALGVFFIAVLLVMAGTYLVFTSGSIVILKLLRRRKKFYYKLQNFTSI